MLILLHDHADTLQCIGGRVGIMVKVVQTLLLQTAAAANCFNTPLRSETLRHIMPFPTAQQLQLQTAATRHYIGRTATPYI
jgi:hypothetical protein